MYMQLILQELTVKKRIDRNTGIKKMDHNNTGTMKLACHSSIGK